MEPTPNDWLDRIASLDGRVRAAELELEDALRELAASPAWLEVSYVDLAEALGVTRQGARQRIARLLEANRYGVELS